MGGKIATLSGDGRHTLSTLGAFVDLFLTLAGKVLILSALYMKFVLEVRVAVVIGNHGGALAYLLIVVGCLMCIVYSASSKVMYDAGSEEGATRRNAKLLVFTQACQLLVVFLLSVALIMTLVHKAVIRDALHSEFIDAIRLYRLEPSIKTALDIIQISFRCCGSHSKSDWFKNPWIAMKYLNADHPDIQRFIVDGDFIKDDAPFSCCDPYAIKPCIHHGVEDKKAHRLAMAASTLYSTGCIEKLEEYWDSYVLNPVFWLLFLILGLQVLALLLCRLLQTSLDEALDLGDPMGEGAAFILRSNLCSLLPTSDPTKALKKKEKKDKEMKEKEEREAEETTGDEETTDAGDSQDDQTSQDDTDVGVTLCM